MASDAKQSEASNDEVEEPATNTRALKVPAHVAIKLFGDSTQTAKLEGRSKLTAKSNKGAAYLQLANGIFSIDDDPAIRTDLLKKQYCAANEHIGKTGAGLKPEDVSRTVRSPTSSEMQTFKWWPRLHGFWRTLPNFNPYTVTSDPGQGLANEAHLVLMGGLCDLDLDESGFYSLATTPDVDDATGSTSVTPFTLTPTDSNKTKHEPLSKTPSRSNTPKTKSLKHTLEEAFAEGSAKQNEILKQVKTLKYEHAMGELDLKHADDDDPKPAEYAASMMQTPTPTNASLEGFGLMAELNDATLPGSSSHTPHAGVEEGQLEVACMLIERGAGVSAQDKDSQTPLHQASKEGQLEVAC
ncbi:hypothetical protein BGY98DRAFT_1103566 [Russula aff. rugulosa BPL654]|nr:hypothetical protein BGY98DRAFT_1103566 [Russula aff. rugulosa BPL654]